MLIKALNIKKNRDLTRTNLETILIDATEVQIQMPKKIQREFFSGKEKKHVIKIEIRTAQKGKILNISNAYRRKIHNFKTMEASAHVPEEVTVLADSSYQGLHNLHSKSVLHYNRKENCRQNKLFIIERSRRNELVSNTFLLI